MSRSRMAGVLTLLSAGVIAIAACGETPVATPTAPAFNPTAAPATSPNPTATVGTGTQTPATQAPNGGQQGNAANGEQIFNTNGCSGCHSTGTDTKVGPGLAGVMERAGTRVSGLSSEAYITQSIRQPTEFVVEGFPPAMPPFGSLTDAQIQDLIAYLSTLQ